MQNIKIHHHTKIILLLFDISIQKYQHNHYCFVCLLLFMSNIDNKTIKNKRSNKFYIGTIELLSLLDLKINLQY